MGKSNFAEQIRNKETYLGIEFGSTRIKAVLTGADIHRSHQEAMTGRISMRMESGPIIWI